MEKRKSMKIQIWENLTERGWVTPLSEPPDAFIAWWAGHDHCDQRVQDVYGNKGWSGRITAHKAWQCRIYRDEFKERRYQNAAGTGVYYAYFGWHRNQPRPRTSNPAFLKRHREWCAKHKQPDPLANEAQTVPKHIREAKSFADVKRIMAQLGEQMDMNKAIGWTQADSAAANKEPL
jgi:hypothetical protein